MPNPPPIKTQNVADDVKIIALIESMKRFEDAVQVLSNTVAQNSHIVIDMQEDFQKFKAEMRDTRNKREEQERQQLLTEYAALEQKIKLTDDKTQYPTTEEKIKIAVDKKMNENKIPWAQIFREKVLPAVITTVSIALTLAALASLLPFVADVLNRAFGGG